MHTTAYKGEAGERGIQGCVRTQKKFFGPQNLKTFLFCTKAAITLSLIIAYRKL